MKKASGRSSHLATLTKTSLKPRKQPVQARSAASVEAILEATLQVLVQVGKERLTTTLVAARAGVSVGTLYQYFPNKSSLLQAALRRHLDEVTQEVERVCREQRGAPLQQMTTEVMTAFLRAKMRRPKASAALYAVSSDVDGSKIAEQKRVENLKSMAAMLETSCEPLSDPALVASMLQGTMVGVSRTLLESPSPEKQFDILLRELVFFAGAYMDACKARR
jgi:AcrR family transcriptional regulator